MPRKYVLDTNVLLFDPGSLYHFQEHDLVLPIVVIEEIDKFKRGMDDRGMNARQVSRELDKLKDQGSLKEGVTLPGGGTLQVLMPSHDQEAVFKVEGNDNDILSMAHHLAAHGNQVVVLVSRDTNMRIKASAVGLAVEDYQHGQIVVALDDQFQGHRELAVESPILEALIEGRTLDLEDNLGFPNENLLLTSGGRKALARISPDQKRLTLTPSYTKGVWGVQPRNKEQTFALDMLLDPNVLLVTLQGRAGTGKTLLALAAGLGQVTDGKARYKRVLVARPIIPMGRDLGYLPGSMDEKLKPWMQPIYDNLEYMIRGSDRQAAANIQTLFDQGFLSVEALTYIRGRSIPQQYLIVDEAQNLTPHEVKTILTRAGQGTKVVLTGDPNQIDNPFVDTRSNGLSYTIERFRESPLAGHITLTKGERGLLAEAASRLL